MSNAYVYTLTLIPDQPVKGQIRDPSGRTLSTATGPTLTFAGDARTRLLALFEQLQAPARPARTLIRDLGYALDGLIFDTTLRTHLLDHLHRVTVAQNGLLRLELVAGDEELAALPWEILHIRGAPVHPPDVRPSAEPHLIFARRIEGWTEVAPIELEAEEKLQVAIVVAAAPAITPEPVDIGPLRLRLEALAAAEAAQFARPSVHLGATADQIDDILENEKPHIFHFVGHTRQYEGRWQVALEQELRLPEWLELEEFAGLFTRYGKTLVLLQPAGEAANQAPQAWPALAEQILNYNVPVVVAMQHPIRPQSVYAFAGEFYSRIAAGDPADKALQEARYQIRDMYRTRDFASPVLFMRLAERHIFTRKARPVVDVAREDPLTEKLRQSLLQLDYSPQQQQFNEAALGGSQRVGAVLITGRPRTGKRWLLGRLTQTARLAGGAAGERVIQADLWDLDPTVGAVWHWLATRVKQPATSSQEAVIEAVLRVRATQHLFIVLENAGDDPGLLQEILTHVWAPLATAARKQAAGKWLLLFLVDNAGHLAAGPVDVPGVDPSLLAQLPPTPNRFPQGELSAWLNNPATLAVPPLIQQRQMVQQQIPTWETDKYPRVTLEEICTLCGLEWTIVEGRWLKT